MTVYKEYKHEVMRALEGKDYIIMSDDLDSYLSTTLVLQHYNPNMTVEGFFKPYGVDKDKGKGVLALSNKVVEGLDRSVGLDVTLTGGITCISNHVESVNNMDYTSKDSVSCNKHIGDGNYFDKSLFSTTLLLWASLGLDLPQDDYGKMVLLSVDATYQGYFKYEGRYKDTLVGYLNAYGLGELTEVLERYSWSDFKQVAKETTLRTDSIGFNNGAIQLDRLGSERALNDILGALGLTKQIDTIDNMESIQYLISRFEDCSSFNYIVGHDKELLLVNYARTYKNSVAFTYFRA